MNTPSDETRSPYGGPGPDDRVRECLDLLRERFPHIDGISLQLLERDATFRELCEEYAACTEAVERLTHSGSDPAMLREYGALRLRVEGELLGYLAEHRRRRS
jgi:hypothetical protein